MSLPTQEDLKTMNYSYNGSPFVYVATKNSIDLKGMDYSSLGEPFVQNYEWSSAVIGNIVLNIIEL